MSEKVFDLKYECREITFLSEYDITGKFVRSDTGAALNIAVSINQEEDDYADINCLTIESDGSCHISYLTDVDVKIGHRDIGNYPTNAEGIYLQRVNNSLYTCIDDKDASDADVVCRVLLVDNCSWRITYLEYIDVSKIDFDILIAQVFANWLYK